MSFTQTNSGVVGLVFGPALLHRTMRRARPSEARSRSPSPPGRGRGAQDDEGRGRKRGRSSSPSPPAPGKERHTWAIAPASDGVDMNDRSERVAAQLERLKKGREERQRATLERRAQGSEGQPMSGEDSDALQAREDAFHLEQARLRAEKRVAEGRGRALDHLFVIAHPNQVKLPSRALVPPPAQLFAPLTDAEKESLSAELRTMEETDLTAASVWRAALALLDPSLPLEGAHAAVLPDIDAVLRGLADKELVKLRDLVQQEARRGDEEYWGSLQRRVRRREAEVLLEDRHLDWIDLHEPVDRAALRDMMRSPWTPPDREQEGGLREEMGRPVRARVRQLSDQEMWLREKNRGLDADEEHFTQEYEGTPTIQEQLKDSSLKKPLSYNRVRSGFEWHHYNRAHYDADNPPPKTTFGYNFNLFYPDLPDGITPQFRLHKTADPDLVVIEFFAGAPYRNVAFKIAQGEWDRFPHMGYKCLYSHHTLQLHFNFRRFHYRR